MNEKLGSLAVIICAVLTGCGGGGGGGTGAANGSNGASTNNGGAINGSGGAVTGDAGSTVGGGVLLPPPIAQQPPGAGPALPTQPTPSTPATSPNATSPMVAIESAISKLYTTNEVYRLTANAGMPDEVFYTRQFVVLPNTTFNNQPVQSVEITNTRQPRSSPAVVLKQVDYFTTSPYVLVGRQFSGDTGDARTVALNRRLLPASGRPGDSDFFYDSATYDQSGQVVYTSRQIWNISADTDNPLDVAAFCITPTVKFAGIASERVGSSDCYKINTTGIVTAVKFISER